MTLQKAAAKLETCSQRLFRAEYFFQHDKCHGSVYCVHKNQNEERDTWWLVRGVRGWEARLHVARGIVREGIRRAKFCRVPSIYSAERRLRPYREQPLLA
jgi:hypothetical protein